MTQSYPIRDSITLRVLDGADRGRIYNDLELPITIGREEGNEIQLNDERISRFHAKLQLDHEQVVLTDLESTNGTKVNGEEVQIRILRYGDLVSVGRSVLLFGSRDQIADRLQQQRTGDTGSESGSNPELQPPFMTGSTARNETLLLAGLLTAQAFEEGLLVGTWATALATTKSC